MIISHKCLECSFEDDVLCSNRIVVCPKCGTKNNFWIDGEIPPENHREQ